MPSWWDRRFRRPILFRWPHTEGDCFISTPCFVAAESPDWPSRPILAGEHESSFYELRAWAVTPNHVHLPILPRTAVRGSLDSSKRRAGPGGPAQTRIGRPTSA